MKRLSLIVVLLTVACVVNAQVNKMAGALNNYHVIFEDNFKDDTIGKFPQKWNLFKSYYSAKAFIKDSLGVRELHTERQVFITPLIEPLVNTGDGLKIEMDYRPDTANNLLSFCVFNETNPKEGNFVDIFHSDSVYFCLYAGQGLEKRERLTQPLVNKKWHRVTYTIRKRLLSLCVDTNCYFIRNDSVAIPQASTITFSFVGNSSIKNVKISTANNTRDFSALSSEKKLVTHAINFDKKKYAITPFSSAYIKDLAAWLKNNPTIELEIDGHTDNDGNKELNAALSLSRANEVRKALVANGIEASRLTTKGYGSEKPIDNTNTPAAKAMNRRVEFIKTR